MKIILRHSNTEYLEKETSLANAKDITTEGHHKISHIAPFLAKYLDFEQEIFFRSSPKGRCIATSKSLCTRLSLPQKIITIDPNLDEVRFKYSLLYALVNGGEFKDQEKQFLFEKKITNPGNLNFGDYLITDQMFYLHRNSKMPEQICEFIDSLERFSVAEMRLFKTLKIAEENSVLVTHAGLTQRMFSLNYCGSRGALGRGEFLVLDSDLQMIHRYEN